jgi:hypothetical protein
MAGRKSNKRAKTSHHDDGGNSMTEESSVTSSARTPHDPPSRSRDSLGSRHIPSVVAAVNETPDEEERSEPTRVSLPRLPVNDDTALLKTIICKDVWPKVKFVTTQNMAYSTAMYSLPRYFAELCHVPPGEREQWWFDVKKLVRNTLSTQRTNKTAQMRLTFMGAYARKLCIA